MRRLVFVLVLTLIAIVIACTSVTPSAPKPPTPPPLATTTDGKMFGIQLMDDYALAQSCPASRVCPQVIRTTAWHFFAVDNSSVREYCPDSFYLDGVVRYTPIRTKKLTCDHLNKDNIPIMMYPSEAGKDEIQDVSAEYAAQ